MSVFKKILLLLAIIGGINWGIYGIWGMSRSRTPCGAWAISC